MISVGLTGNVGSGKSTVAALWEAAGVPVVSADALSRQAVLPGSRGLEAVRAEFGDGVLAPDGTLDRARMRAIVFADEARRRRLEDILHPLIAEQRARWVDERRAAGESLVVSEVPLLFEKDLEGDFDVTVLVDAPAQVRLERVVRQRGLDTEAARQIMAAQMDPARKRARADFVIDNSGPTAQLEAEAARVLASLTERAGAPDAPSPGVGPPTGRGPEGLFAWTCTSIPGAPSTVCRIQKPSSRGRSRWATVASRLPTTTVSGLRSPWRNAIPDA